MFPTRQERIEEFYRRMRASAPASSAQEARELLERTLDVVEDELAGVPFDPTAWMTDGRLYPPQNDHFFPVAHRPEVVRARTRGHNVFIASNGAIEIREHKVGIRPEVGHVAFAKLGADGKGVWA